MSSAGLPSFDPLIRGSSPDRHLSRSRPIVTGGREDGKGAPDDFCLPGVRKPIVEVAGTLPRVRQLEHLRRGAGPRRVGHKTIRCPPGCRLQRPANAAGSGPLRPEQPAQAGDARAQRRAWRRHCARLARPGGWGPGDWQIDIAAAAGQRGGGHLRSSSLCQW